MEQKYFTWAWRDEMDDFVVNYYECTVVQPFGEFQVGDKIGMAIIDFERGFFNCFHNSGGILFSGKFELMVKE